MGKKVKAINLKQNVSLQWTFSQTKEVCRINFWFWTKAVPSQKSWIPFEVPFDFEASKVKTNGLSIFLQIREK